MTANNNNHATDDAVVDRAKFSWSDLWKKEDFWAIWLASIVFLLGFFIFFTNTPKDMEQNIAKDNAVMQAESENAPFKTIAWYEANNNKGKLKAASEPSIKKITTYLERPMGWTSNPLQSFMLTGDEAKAKSEKATANLDEAKSKTAAALAKAKAAEEAAAAQDFKNSQLNEEAKKYIADWRSAVDVQAKINSAANTKAYNLFASLPVLCLLLALFFALGRVFMGQKAIAFIRGFIFIFFLAVIAYFLSAQADIKAYGIEYVAWALVLGLIISNTVGTPKWVVPAVQTEYYIKTGLVLLGSSILFGKILLIGVPGIFVTWVVTPIVLISTFLFGQKVLGIKSKSLNITVSADMAVCGVSAAIATAAACRAKKEELTLAVGLSIIFTSVMMILMPIAIKAMSMHPVLGGAWIGGTIDATGAVVAAGAYLGETSMQVAATIKMIQNVLIGVIAFGVAYYWVSQVDSSGQRVGLSEVWHRFPKFILGFIGASILFSYAYQLLGEDVGKVMIDEGIVKAWTSSLQGWFFAFAFVSIGLATNFRQLGHYLKDGKAVILYLVGQTFNLILTLLMAYIMFFHVFPGVTEKLMAP